MIQKINKKWLGCIAILLAMVFASCKKDGPMVTATQPTSGSTVTASTNSVMGMGLATQDNNAVTFSWDSVGFGANTPVTYTLQYDSVGKGFTNPLSYPFGLAVYQGAITQSTLNTLGMNAGIPQGDTGTLEFRIMASLGVQSELPVYSNVVTVNFNTYFPRVYWYVPGDYQGWDPASAPQILSTDNDNFSGFVYVPSSSSATYEFKITNAPDWNHTSYGTGSTVGTIDPSGGNLVWPDSGKFYQLNVVLSSLTWSATPFTFTVAGDFNGWSTSASPMTYDPATSSWTYTGSFTDGGFKIVGNGGTWCGGDGSTNTLYFGGGDNISISAGTHTILANFSTPGAYTYSVQ